MTVPNHVHHLEPKPAKDYLPKSIPARHPAINEPFPMPAWVCRCGYVTWTSEWFRGR
jgi:hypothetical protein